MRRFHTVSTHSAQLRKHFTAWLQVLTICAICLQIARVETLNSARSLTLTCARSEADARVYTHSRIHGNSKSNLDTCILVFFKNKSIARDDLQVCKKRIDTLLNFTNPPPPTEKMKNVRRM